MALTANIHEKRWRWSTLNRLSKEILTVTEWVEVKWEDLQSFFFFHLPKIANNGCIYASIGDLFKRTIQSLETWNISIWDEKLAQPFLSHSLHKQKQILLFFNNKKGIFWSWHQVLGNRLCCSTWNNKLFQNYLVGNWWKMLYQVWLFP